MYTTTHASLANIFSWTFKKEWPKERHIFLFLGAWIPDVPTLIILAKEFPIYAMNHLEVFASWGGFFRTYRYFIDLASDHRDLMLIRDMLHLVCFWILLGLLFSKTRFSKNIWALVWGAIIFHIGVDWPTHMESAHTYYLWPLVQRPMPGFVAHPNLILSILEACISVVWCVMFYKQFRNQKKNPA